MYEVKMPQWGMNMTEGDIVKWLKQVGERVEKGEELVEIETAKSVNALESPVAGTLAEIVVGEGECALIQETIARIEEL